MNIPTMVINTDGGKMPAEIVSSPRLVFIQREKTIRRGLILSTATFAGSDELGSPVYADVNLEELPVVSPSELEWMTFLPIRFHYNMALVLGTFANNPMTAGSLPILESIPYIKLFSKE